MSLIRSSCIVMSTAQRLGRTRSGKIFNRKNTRTRIYENIEELRQHSKRLFSSQIHIFERKRVS